MAQQESSVLLVAQIREPIPIERRFAADNQIVLVKWLQSNQKPLGLFRIEIPMEQLVAAMIDDAHMHGVGVQIDSAVEFVLLVVKLHLMYFLERVGLSHEPSSVEAATC